MRTTLVIEDDVLEVARSLADSEGKTLGQVISGLARRGLTSQHQESLDEGFPIFSITPNSKPISSEIVRQALEEA